MIRNVSTTTTAATATKPTMYELNERNKDSPVHTNEYEIESLSSTVILSASKTLIRLFQKSLSTVR